MALLSSIFPNCYFLPTLEMFLIETKDEDPIQEQKPQMQGMGYGLSQVFVLINSLNSSHCLNFFHFLAYTFTFLLEKQISPKWLPLQPIRAKDQYLCQPSSSKTDGLKSRKSCGRKKLKTCMHQPQISHQSLLINKWNKQNNTGR